MKVLVREATLNDAQLIADLTRKAWKNRVTPTSAGHHETHDSVSVQLQTGGGFILLVDDVAAGSIRWISMDEDSGVWEIQRIGIVPQFCRMNLSQYLIEAIINHAKISEINELRLALHAGQDRLFDYYAAFGFESAPELEKPHREPDEPPPAILRKVLRNH